MWFEITVIIELDWRQNAFYVRDFQTLVELSYWKRIREKLWHSIDPAQILVLPDCLRSRNKS